MKTRQIISLRAVAMLLLSCAVSSAQQVADPLPSSPLKFGAFVIKFDPGGTFTLQGQGWPALSGKWKTEGSIVELTMSGGPGGCDGPGRYDFRMDGNRLRFKLVADDCRPRKMIVDSSIWAPAGEAKAIPVRQISLKAGKSTSSLPKAKKDHGSWPSFRGPAASGIAEKQNLPDRWDAKTGENILWRTPIPGLAHSSPVVWGDMIFVTSAVSSDPKATFRPGLYGDGDASKDASVHRWMIYAIDKRSGKIKW